MPEVNTAHSGSPSLPVLVHSIEIAASVDDVWRAITEPEFTAQYFFGYLLRGKVQKGAAIVYETPDGTEHIRGEILDLVERRRLRMSVRVLRDAQTTADAPSRITWELEPVDGGCRVTVVHDDFVGTTATYHTVKGGWPTVLRGLEELLTEGSVDRTFAEWPPHVQARAGRGRQ